MVMGLLEQVTLVGLGAFLAIMFLAAALWLLHDWAFDLTEPAAKALGMDDYDNKDDKDEHGNQEH